MPNARPLPRLFLALAFAASVSLPAQTVSQREVAQRYLADVKALSAPAMEGRGAGTKGIARASHLIEQQYRALGLEPAGTSGYLQPFTVITGAELKGKNSFHVQGNTKSELKLNQDFVPFSFSASGEASAPAVFAGYGITAPEFGYDDYTGIDVKDKIVVLLRYEPSTFAAKNGNSGMTQHAQLVAKAINARNHGAKAVVLANGKLGPGEEDLLTRFGSVSGPVDTGVVLVQVKNEQAGRWLQAAGKSLAEVQDQINSTGKPASFALPDTLHLSLAVDVEHTHATVNNVIAYLPGETDEYVIVGAHYDHLGLGAIDSLAPSQIGRIHPGADDNASGTAGVLELARQFAGKKTKRPRGILFMNFAGEELGLLGSAEWIAHPTKPLEKAVAMLNMDMIGRIHDGKVFIGGVGTGSTLKAVVEQAPPEPGLTIEYSASGYASSDHTSFVARKIPVLFFFSGLHADYHKPSDTWEKINAKSAAQLLGLVENVAERLAAAPERPEFQAVKEETAAGAPSGGGGYGPYFGSVPDFGQIETGVKFSDVKPGSPADKAGLKAGDILIQFGEKPIKNLYDFTDALRRSKVGDVVEVQVLRDGKPLTAKVTLEQRR